MKLRFVYKVYAPYDGFYPSRLPERLDPGNLLTLGWKRYLDDVERGSRVWLYFHDGAKQRLAPGVYAKTTVTEVDYTGAKVRVRVDEYDPEETITDDATSRGVSAIVATRGQQVLPLPRDWAPTLRGVVCSIDTDGKRCAERQCLNCPTWRRLRRINSSELMRPPKLGQVIEKFAPAYWVIPSRSFIYREGTPSPMVDRMSHVFYSFKHGAKEFAFPLALGMQRALEATGFHGADAIVPIPLSPEKAARGEIHRSRLLARELATLMGVPVREWLKLEAPISKRQSRTKGLSDAQHWDRYRRLLAPSNRVRSASRVLLVDDVSTKGGTLRSAAAALASVNPNVAVDASTAGQMIIKAAVADHQALIT